MLLARLPPPLHPAETRKLIHVAQSDPDPAVRLRARNRVVETNLRLCLRVARAYVRRGLDLGELVAEGAFGLMTAVERFEISRGLAFTTFATWWVRHHIGRAVIDRGRTVRVPVHLVDKLTAARRAGVEHGGCDGVAITGAGLHLDTPLGGGRAEERGTFHDVMPSDAATPEELVDGAERERLARGLLNELESLEMRTVIELRFGLDGQDERTLLEVGTTLRTEPISRERVRQIQSEAIEELRSLVA